MLEALLGAVVGGLLATVGAIMLAGAVHDRDHRREVARACADWLAAAQHISHMKPGADSTDLTRSLYHAKEYLHVIGSDLVDGVDLFVKTTDLCNIAMAISGMSQASTRDSAVFDAKYRYEHSKRAEDICNTFRMASYKIVSDSWMTKLSRYGR